MPYDSIAQLPEHLKASLPLSAQHIYRHVYNSAYELHGRDAVAASRSAERAINQFYDRTADGRWIHK